MTQASQNSRRMTLALRKPTLFLLVWMSNVLCFAPGLLAFQRGSYDQSSREPQLVNTPQYPAQQNQPANGLAIPPTRQISNGEIRNGQTNTNGVTRAGYYSSASRPGTNTNLGQEKADSEISSLGVGESEESLTSESQKDDFLPPPSNAAAGGIDKPNSTFGVFATMFFALAIVLGLLFGLTFIVKKSQGSSGAALPKDVLQVLGSTQIGPRQRLVLLRVGKKLLLVSQQMGGVEAVCEVDDPQEVDRLCGLVEQTAKESITNSFQEALLQVTSLPANRFGKRKLA